MPGNTALEHRYVPFRFTLTTKSPLVFLNIDDGRWAEYPGVVDQDMDRSVMVRRPRQESAHVLAGT